MVDESRISVENVEEKTEDRACQVSRRSFLQVAGMGAATAAMVSIPGCGNLLARTTSLPPKLVWSLDKLQVDKPVYITYPDKASRVMLVKLGVAAGGGVGPDKDIVAYSVACPHMGTTLIGAYNAKHKGLGPCPSHLTRFDLVRYGIVVSGHATESLPQILLEVQGNDIHATGIRGLVYGRTQSVS